MFIIVIKATDYSHYRLVIKVGVSKIWKSNVRNFIFLYCIYIVYLVSNIV